MELAAENKLSSSAQYSPTSTPVLDVFRPLPPQTKEGLSAGEYFLASSLVILTLIGLPWLRAAIVSAPWWVMLVPVAAALAAAAVHEGGHLLAGMLSGFKLTQIRLGSFGLGRHVKCREPYCGDVLTLGPMALEPRERALDEAGLRRRLVVLLAGGPLASFAWACALELLQALTQPGL